MADRVKVGPFLELGGVADPVFSTSSNFKGGIDEICREGAAEAIYLPEERVRRPVEVLVLR